MIAVDTSSLVAVVLGEPDAERHLDRLQRGPAQVSSVSLVEATIVVDARQGADAVRDLELLVEATTDIVAVDVAHARAALAAWRRFGRGRHPAGLNFGDCFSYALARLADVPLLYKGYDFAQTDVAAAL